MSENTEQGVGVRKADLDFDENRGNDEENVVDEGEQRRQFALSFASQTTGATEVDILLSNAKKIEDFLKGSVVDNN